MASALARSRPWKAAMPRPASRAARTWVSVMLPQPTKPAWRAMCALLDEGRRLALRALLGETAREDQQPVPESGGGAGREREVQRLLPVAEDALPERVRGEEAVAAGMPVGGIAGVLRVVEHQQHDVLAL